MNGLHLGHQRGKNISGRNPMCLIEKGYYKGARVSFGLGVARDISVMTLPLVRWNSIDLSGFRFFIFKMRWPSRWVKEFCTAKRVRWPMGCLSLTVRTRGLPQTDYFLPTLCGGIKRALDSGQGLLFNFDFSLYLGSVPSSSSNIYLTLTRSQELGALDTFENERGC